MSNIEKLKTYTDKQIEEMDKEQLKQELKKNTRYSKRRK